MKRLALMFLILMLILCGCGEEQKPAETTEPTVTIPEETEPPTFGHLEYQYDMDAGEQLERYGLAGGGYYGLASLGEGALLFSGETETTLTYVDRENHYISTVLSGLLLEPQATVVTDKGITYYDAPTHSLVTLDSQLMTVSRVGLSEDVPRELLLSEDGKLVYYHTGTQLRCLDWRTGISRLLKETAGAFEQIVGLYFEDTLLRCTLSEGESTKTLLVSTETGETLFSTEEPLELTTCGQSFFIGWQELGQPLRLSGQWGGELQKLLPAWEGEWYYRPDFAVAWRTDELGTDLMWYDLLENGHCASLRLSGVDTPMGMISDPETGELWFLAGEKGTDKFFFYHWNPQNRPIRDGVETLTSYYSAQFPDEEGLQQCRDRVQAMGEQYGLEIRIWEDGGTTLPDGCRVTIEHDVNRYESFLPKLEKAIAAYPSEIYEKLSRKSNNRKLTLCLVREIYNSDELGSQTPEQGVYFIKGGNIYLLLTLDEVIESTYYHELFHAMDSYIIMETKAFDEWNTLNPEGFVYDNSYIANENRNPGPYLRNEYRSFIDRYSMSYPKEDRARVMEYAMTEGNHSYFTTATMIRKLEALNTAIREAFGLEEEQTYRWEQYRP